MLDLFTVFTKSGLVLWSFLDHASVKSTRGVLDGDPIGALVNKELVEGKGSESETFIHGDFAVEYRLDNAADLVFAAVYKKSLKQNLAYVGELLDRLKATFLAKYADEVENNAFQNYSFAEFQKIRKDVEDGHRAKMGGGGGVAGGAGSAAKTKKPKSFESSSKFRKTKKFNEDLQAGKIDQSKRIGEPDDDSDDGADTPPSSPVAAESKADRMARNIAELKAKRPVSPGKKLTKAQLKKLKNKEANDAKQVAAGQAAGAVPQVLDFGNGEEAPEEDLTNIDVGDVSAGGGKDIDDTYHVPVKQKSGGGVFSYFSKFTTGTKLTDEILAPALEKTRNHLISKNVASEIAEKICEAVGASIKGKDKGAFQNVTTVVQDSVESSLTRILSPARRVDIIRDVTSCKAKGVPYSICFCGVNGVGKSTNLSKICYWLLQNDFSVCIAACDTFRAGAVEQLKVHMLKLNALMAGSDNDARITLFDQGYGKDPAGIARDAISFSKNEGIDVVLIDTAGRMQDNTPLMAALAKLVSVNKPELVLFVGEALVGNEAVDQLTKFNQALADHSTLRIPRLIDGIVLSKFDTIDDKVGAAVSMSYTSGQPIVFVGTGQKYGDLKKLNVKSVVAALLA